MGVMREKLLFTVAIMAILAVPTKAAMTVEQSTDAEYLINQGFSQMAAEDVFIQKNRANGKSIEPLYEKSQNKFVKVCKRIYAYLDPSIDEPDRIHHDIKPSPSYSDL